METNLKKSWTIFAKESIKYNRVPNTPFKFDLNSITVNIRYVNFTEIQDD